MEINSITEKEKLMKQYQKLPERERAEVTGERAERTSYRGIEVFVQVNTKKDWLDVF